MVYIGKKHSLTSIILAVVDCSEKSQMQMAQSKRGEDHWPMADLFSSDQSFC